MKNHKSESCKTLGMLLTLSLLLTAFTPVAMAAETYPSKPVRLIAAVAPGGPVDIVGRQIAAKLSERLGKQVVVENHSGGGGIIGTEMVAKAAPDGYTLLVVNPTQTIQPAFQKLPYDSMNSFAPIALLASTSQALVVHPSVPANSVKELIALATQKPGQLIFASSGSGSSVHMAIELFKMMADIDFKIVQFKSSGPAMTDLLGGHSHAMITSITGVAPHIKSGKLRVLGTSAAKRSIITPDVPTIAEAGVPGYETTTWYGSLAPAGTPAPIVERLSKEIQSILDSDEVKKQFLSSGGEVDYRGPTEFGTFFKNEMDKWASVIKKGNIKRE